LKAVGVVVFAAITLPAKAEADTACGAPGHPWVAVVGSIAELPDVVPLMRAELSARQIDVCSDAAGHTAPPIATVDVAPQGQGAAIAVEVRDRLTAKRIVREVDLAAVPADGRALTLAAAAEELLRATWAELALTTAPPPAAPVPHSVETLVEDARPPRRAPVEPAAEPTALPAPWVGVTTMAAFEFSSGGILYGGDVRVTAPVGRRFAGVARAGFREAPVTSSRDGYLYTSVILAGLGGSFRTTPPGARYALDVLARVDAGRVSYAPVANPTAIGSGGTGWAVLASGGLDAWVALGTAVRFVCELLVEVPVRPVHATDAGRPITSVAGVGAATGVGLGVVF
jgi:hypothetical protein